MRPLLWPFQLTQGLDGTGAAKLEFKIALKFIAPMMPTLVDEPPADDEWIHEIKHGYRTELLVENGSALAPGRQGAKPDRRTAPHLAKQLRSATM